MRVRLADVTRDNWNECVRLRVKPEQERFVAGAAYSLCQAHYEGGLRPQLVYAGDTAVGLVMYSDERHPEWGYWIIRLLIAGTHQGRGFGRQAMEETLAALRARPDCEEVFISYDPENTAAERLYSSLGFQKTGAVVESEIVMSLRWD